ncbi:MAG: MerC domain-containing protein [Novosphingobium sp.]
MRDAVLAIRNRLDRMGMMLSGLCAVHCLLGLLLVSVLGLGGGILLAPEVHEIGLALAVGIGVLTLGLGALRHGRTGPLLIGGAGIALMAGALMVPHGPGEAALTIVGVALVALAHIRNLRHAA